MLKQILTIFVITLACRAMTFCGATAQGQVRFDWVTVGNPGNGADVQPQGTFGAVPYVYRISKHLVTNAQYATFLNAVDPLGANPNLGGPDPFLYNPFMSSSANGGINLDLSAANGRKYQVKTGHENNPVIFVSFFDAMRFTNWLENGQGNGSTETGVYTIASGLTETRNPRARFFIPNEDEWYKAAYHKNDGVTANYWRYATSTDAIPFSAPPPGTSAPDASNTANFFKNDNVANGFDNGYAATGSPQANATQSLLTDVGAYTKSLSPYGTFDQAGNVWEWTESVTGSFTRGLRGGSWISGVEYISAAGRFETFPAFQYLDIGFRVASSTLRIDWQSPLEHELSSFRSGVTAIPEPHAAVWSLIGVVCVLWRERRFRVFSRIPSFRSRRKHPSS